ncbi:hypothetical protein [uncultured Roseobacter sp.]|uniref:hypothetical protein n=1 Tax=uncultured Roseobacter sp. TaxID=114847 RepID=UPI002627949C|nr:hypothetical protein [uncultured Roseobacter sp.]
MPKPTKTTLFKALDPQPETAMDKTTRVVREIIDEEAQQRQVKIARLRTARLEREANTPTDSASATKKKHASKAVKKG